MMRLAFHVQHLLGIGHLVRAHRIATAAADAGFDVTLLDGGKGGPAPPEGISRIQLPPATTADLAFTDLLDADTGEVVDDAWREERRDAALSALSRTAPDILLVEGYPFARRKFAFELDPLIAAAKDRGIPVVSSIRDILVRKAPEKTEKIARKAADLFDAILVHGDESFCRLKESFADAEILADKLVYTGYIAPDPLVYTSEGGANGLVYTSGKNARFQGPKEIVISCGGGAVGGRLLRTALGAYRQAQASESPIGTFLWRFLIGPNLPEDDRAIMLEAQAKAVCSTLHIEDARQDFTALLGRAALSVSQAGYNTVCDLAVTGTPAVLVPFEGPDRRETEQPMRAALLESAGYAAVVSETELSPRTLLEAMECRINAPVPDHPPFRTDGAERTAKVLRDLIVRKAEERRS